jgi:hypothetical protein
MKTRYEIGIDRLVLHGVPAAQRRAIREAVEREVARRAEAGSLQSSAGPLTLPATPGDGRRSS